MLNTTNYYKVIDLIISCGDKDFRGLVEMLVTNQQELFLISSRQYGHGLKSLNSNVFIRQISLVYWQMNALTLQLLRSYIYAVGGLEMENPLSTFSKSISLWTWALMEQQLFLGRTQAFRLDEK